MLKIQSYERIRRAQGIVHGEFLITIDSPLDSVVKNSENNKRLIDAICQQNAKESPPNIQLIGYQHNVFGHEEADVSIINYLFLLIQSVKILQIQILADDTDIILLMYFYWNKQPNVKISTKKFNCVIDNNASALRLGSKCDQLLAMHALTGCDSKSYPY